MTDHARQNALAWLETIEAGMTAVRELEEIREAVTHDGETYDDADSLREALQERALSVLVRGTWHSPGDDAGARAPVEYEILLTTGGPALRIRGDLGDWDNPTSARLEYQDWGTPWTALALSRGEADAVEAFASLFYFGDGN